MEAASAHQGRVEAAMSTIQSTQAKFEETISTPVEDILVSASQMTQSLQGAHQQDTKDSDTDRSLEVGA
jgi:hypothetical protein